MYALAGYTSEDDAGAARPPPDIAPAVDTIGLALVSSGPGSGVVVPLGATKELQQPGKHVVYHNPRAQDLFAPAAGPAHPYRRQGAAGEDRNHPTGHVEDAHLDTFVFDDQYNTFQSYGYSMEPSGEGFIGDAGALQQRQGTLP